MHLSYALLFSCNITLANCTGALLLSCMFNTSAPSFPADGQDRRKSYDRGREKGRSDSSRRGYRDWEVTPGRSEAGTPRAKVKGLLSPSIYRVLLVITNKSGNAVDVFSEKMMIY